MCDVRRTAVRQPTQGSVGGRQHGRLALVKVDVPRLGEATALPCASSANFLRFSRSADLYGACLAIRSEMSSCSVALSVLGIMPVPSRSGIILRSMDVCHRPDSKQYACEPQNSHTPMTTKWTSRSTGLWFAVVLP